MGDGVRTHFGGPVGCVEQSTVEIQLREMTVQHVLHMELCTQPELSAQSA